MNLKKTIALIYGGEGHERTISLLSARCVRKLLDKEKYDALNNIEIAEILSSGNKAEYVPKNGAQ